MTTGADEQNAISDNSDDGKYFTITPRLVWVLARDPYDFTLWCVIKDIAGKKGECYLSTPDLATLAMMSDGKVSSSRAYLIEKGLLRGQIKRDPGYPQPVWHLSVPNIWKANIEWCEEHNAIADRIAYKLGQHDALIAEKSLHVVKPSPGEEGGSPGETKKIQKEDPPSRAPSKNVANTYRKDLEASLFRGMAVHQDDFENGIDLVGYPEDTHEVIRETCRLWGFRMPMQKSKRAKWIGDARELLNVCGELGLEPIRKERQRVVEYMGCHQGVSPYTYKDLGSLVGPVGGMAAQMRTSENVEMSIDPYDAFRKAGYVIHGTAGA